MKTFLIILFFVPLLLIIPCILSLRKVEFSRGISETEQLRILKKAIFWGIISDIIGFSWLALMIAGAYLWEK